MLRKDGLSRELSRLLTAVWGVLVLASLILVSGSFVQAAESVPTLENITFERESTSRETVIFKLNGPHIPKTFATKGDVPKVVFDFIDVKHSAAVKGGVNSGGNLIKKIRVGAHAEPETKTRVVLDLVAGGEYDFSQDYIQNQNKLVITVFRAGKQEEKKAEGAVALKNEKKADVPSVSAASPTVTKKSGDESSGNTVAKASASPKGPSEKKPVPSGATLLNSISFEKSPEKGEKVLFQVDNFRPPVIFGIEEGTPTIVCDFLEATPVTGLAETIQTQGDYIRKIRVEPNAKARKTRVVLELIPNQHYDLQQIYFKEERLYILFLKTTRKVKQEGKRP